MEKKRREIEAEIDHMNWSLGSSEAFEDFERVNFALTTKSFERGAHFKLIWNAYDFFQQSLDLYRSDLLEARISRSIKGNGNVERLMKNRFSSVRDGVIAALEQYMSWFQGEEIEELLTSPEELFIQWGKRIAKLEKLMKPSGVKQFLDYANRIAGDVAEMNHAADQVLTAKESLLAVYDYIEEFYTDEATHRPVSKEKLDSVNLLMMNADWSWRLYDNDRAIEMAEEVHKKCMGYIGSLQMSFGELPERPLN
ncbi:hypothetical protein LCGC14_2130780 [marine sediment metagenome]|uniref:Uncharacterized protein n=1 Tax=marine sediment metagenome TaxID=412755 RepID=A0A0F9GXN6_9ZZZZ